jgi:hypothetical protein
MDRLVCLEQLELQGLLKLYHPDAKTQFASDGTDKIVEALKALAAHRLPIDAGQPNGRFRATVYALSEAEVFTPNVAMPLLSGPVQIIVAGDTVSAQIILTAPQAPGQNGELNVVFDRPIQVGDVQRFLILNKEHLTAVGVLKAEGLGDIGR